MAENLEELDGFVRNTRPTNLALVRELYVRKLRSSPWHIRCRQSVRMERPAWRWVSDLHIFRGLKLLRVADWSPCKTRLCPLKRYHHLQFLWELVKLCRCLEGLETIMINPWTATNMEDYQKFFCHDIDFEVIPGWVYSIEKYDCALNKFNIPWWGSFGCNFEVLRRIHGPHPKRTVKAPRGSEDDFEDCMRFFSVGCGLESEEHLQNNAE